MKNLKEIKKIKDASDYIDYCDDLLCDFVDAISSDERYSEEWTGDDQFEWVTNYKGSILMERYISRLHRLGEKLFPDDYMEIRCSGIEWF